MDMKTEITLLNSAGFYMKLINSWNEICKHTYGNDEYLIFVAF